MQAALDAGLEIPEQVGLIGVGAHQYSKYLKVPLSTIEQQRPLIGREAARLLLDFVQKGEPTRPKQILLEPQLVIRASSSPAPARNLASRASPQRSPRAPAEKITLIWRRALRAIRE